MEPVDSRILDDNLQKDLERKNHKMKVTIRRLNKKDAVSVYQMGIREPGFCFDSDSPGFWTQDQLFKWIASPHDICFGAFSNGQLVGFVLTAIHVPTGKATWENLYVLPKYRGYKIGEKLEKALLKEVGRKSVSYFCFLTDSTKKSLGAYFERLGYKHCGTFIWFSKNLHR